jgi:hypothetical protein
MATVHVLMADYASVDTSGKLNVLGASISVVGLTSNLPVPLTAPVFLVVHVSVPPEGHGQECVVNVGLRDESDAVVTIGGDQERPVVEHTQTVRFPEPMLPPNLILPEGSADLHDRIRGHLQMVLGWPIGLPLVIGRAYQWRIMIDGQTREDWTEQFVVAEQVGPLAVAAV